MRSLLEIISWKLSSNHRQLTWPIFLGLTYLQVSINVEITPLATPLPIRMRQGMYPDNRRGSISVTIRKMPTHVMRASVMATPTTNIFVTVCRKLNRKNAVTTSPLPAKTARITAQYITTKPQFIWWSSRVVWLKNGVIVVLPVVTSSIVAVWPSDHPIDSVPLVIAPLVVFHTWLNIIEGKVIISWWLEFTSRWLHAGELKHTEKSMGWDSKLTHCWRRPFCLLQRFTSKYLHP